MSSGVQARGRLLLCAWRGRHEAPSHQSSALDPDAFAIADVPNAPPSLYHFQHLHRATDLEIKEVERAGAQNRARLEQLDCWSSRSDPVPQADVDTPKNSLS